MASSSESICVVSRFRAAAAGWSGASTSSSGLSDGVGELSPIESVATSFGFSEGVTCSVESAGASATLSSSEGERCLAESADACSVCSSEETVFAESSCGSPASSLARSGRGVDTAGVGSVFLNSADGVQAHSKMKTSTKMKETVFLFTAAKLRIFEQLKELMELKGVKRQ